MDYRRVADEVAGEIESGVLRPGDRLSAQRAFARRRRIAVSTAIRVYGELGRRGLVVGEVGRGTFVRAAPPHPGSVLAEDSGRTPVNLELNYPVVEGQSELMTRSLGGLLRPDVLTEATRPAAADGTARAREAAAGLLARPGWRPHPDRVLFAGNGRQAIAAALSALVRPGARLGVEELTYPLVKAVAEQLGIVLVPLAMDTQGVLPEALAAAHRRTSLSAVYLQPTLHNPLTLTMGWERRAQLAVLLGELGLMAIEDTTWAFLAPTTGGERDAAPGTPQGGAPGPPSDSTPPGATPGTSQGAPPPPLAAYAPARTVLIDSLSKRLAPGLTTGFLVVPEPHTDALAQALRSGAWTAGRFNLEAAVRWAGDGTVEAVGAAKRADAAARHALVRTHLGSFRVRSDPAAYYCWWELPAPWRAETFAAAAAERLGVAVTPGTAFAVGGRVPTAVRIGLATPPVPVLAGALRRLADLASTVGP
ncbi:aminotransferase-like domain-containing protein [Streptomyces violascens]|uniref:GntR family transcriptional regulator n=1 Tax=Streptomyces violascens TaxID=67381 RepID=A0ABQ3QMR5_9ACTN|nr:PLP-dependent aminotransferase family protein [Streptomyces violascens]GGU31198.1 GntR family transcriptional regulator [Streptomyces violascens]GHI38561.1 GntR family transcriptional regulator [Streptomyces violascens]